MTLTINSLGNPIMVTGTTEAAQTVYTGRIKVRALYWHKPTTAGHLLSLLDDNSRQIIKLTAPANNVDVGLVEIREGYDGLIIDDMDSGELYIFTDFHSK